VVVCWDELSWEEGASFQVSTSWTTDELTSCQRNHAWSGDELSVGLAIVVVDESHVDASFAGS